MVLSQLVTEDAANFEKLKPKLFLLLCNVSALIKNCFDETLETYEVAEITPIDENKACIQLHLDYTHCEVS